MNQPLVSVVIPTYNRAYIIQKSIQSVLDQTFRDFELIIMDDGSRDATKEVVESFHDDRIRYFWQENGGQSSARNHGASYARGTWIAFHDSDDTWMPEKLEKQVKAAREHPEFDVIFTKLAMKNKDGTVTCFPKRVSGGPVSIHSDVYGIGIATVMVRREVFQEELFTQDMRRYEDLEWIYRTIRKHRVFCLDEPLMEYTIGADSVSANYDNMYSGLLWLSEHYPEMKKESPATALHSARDLLEGWYKTRKSGKKAEAKKYWQLMLKFFPGLRALLGR